MSKYIRFFETVAYQNIERLQRFHDQYNREMRQENEFLNDERDTETLDITDDSDDSNNSFMMSDDDVESETDDDDCDDDDDERKSNDGDENGRTNSTYVSRRNILRQLRIVKQIDFHEEVAEHQRKAYNRMTTDVKYYNNAILLEFDFKQKMLFG